MKVYNKILGLIALVLVFVMPLKADVAGNEYMGYWEVSFMGFEYDAGENQTYFYYNVASVSSFGKDLSHWVLGLEDGMIVVAAYVNGQPYQFGPNPLHVDPTTGLFGFKFDDGQPLGTSWDYIVVLSGQWGVDEGVFALKSGSNQNELSVSFGEVEVPGAPVLGEDYSISGFIFIDVNGNGIFDEGEIPLAGIPVKLNGSVAGISNGDGYYVFEGLSAGTYIVEPYPEGGSLEIQELAEYLIPVTPQSIEVILGPSAEDVDFGYDLELIDILDDIVGDDPVLDGVGKTIGFWKHQLSVIENKRGRSQVSKSEIDALIGAVNSYFLPDPFVIGSYKDAIDIFDSRSPEAEALLKKQLLAAEFNKFYGIGLENQILMNVILQYAEAVIHFGPFSREEVLLVKDILDAINNLGH